MDMFLFTIYDTNYTFFQEFNLTDTEKVAKLIFKSKTNIFWQ